MPLGRKARGQGQKWGAFGAAVSTLPIPLVFKCIWWHRPGQGHGYLAALVVDFCVSGAERRQELGSLGVTFTWSITLLYVKEKWRAFCAAPSIGSFSVPFNSASLFSNSFSEKERSVTTGTEQQLSLRVQQLSLWVQSHMTLLLISAAAPDVFTRNST